MRRDLERLARGRFDVLVVGGGIHGAAAAREAARAGMSTALVEAGDFCGETSANSLKIIHGGLRHLQRGDVRRVRDAVADRRFFLRVFPGLVRPLPCAVPTRGAGRSGRLALGAALALNDALSPDRNGGVPPEGRLPRGSLITRERMLAIAPGLDPSGLSGGAQWHDGIAVDSERVVLALVRDAAGAGAAVANHVRAEGILRVRGAVAGVAARDAVAGEPLEIRARVVVNAAGPWLDEVNRSLGEAPDIPLARAVNLFVPRRLCIGGAVGLPGDGGRFLFFVPWRGGTLIGTSYVEHAGPAGPCAATAADVASLAAEANRAFPAARILPAEVRFVHAGLLPLRPGGAGAPAENRLLRRPEVIDGGRALGAPGLIGIRGVKYTSGPRVARAAVARAAAMLGRTFRPAPEVPLPDRTPGPGGPPSGGEGSRDGRGCHPSDPAGAAAVMTAVRDEMALTLGDVVFRRTGLGTAGHPGREALEAAAALAGAELGWDGARRRAEIEAVEERYRAMLGWERR